MQTEKILMIGPAWIGDMVMAQALFKLLKSDPADPQIDVLAPAWSQPLLARMPEVNTALALPLTHGQLALRQRWQMGRDLRSQQYHQAIVLPNSWKSALIPYAANIPLRTGWRGEWRYGLLNDIRHLDKIRLPLMVQRFLALGLAANTPISQNTEHKFRPSLQASPEGIAAALTKFNLASPTQPVLALCPGAEFGPAKRWPAEHYAQIAKQKLAEGWLVWLFGSAKDQPVAAEIQQATQNRCMDFTGRTLLGEAVDLLSLADLVVSNDSGLMHIAAALDRPLIVVYGSSSPAFTPPLSDKVRILSLELSCSPCFQRECPLTHFKCLKDLSPEQVTQAISDLVMV